AGSRHPVSSADRSLARRGDPGRHESALRKFRRNNSCSQEKPLCSPGRDSTWLRSILWSFYRSSFLPLADYVTLIVLSGSKSLHLTEAFMADARLRFDQIGYWSQVKLEIVRDYAQAYSTILANQPR